MRGRVVGFIKPIYTGQGSIGSAPYFCIGWVRIIHLLATQTHLEERGVPDAVGGANIKPMPIAVKTVFFFISLLLPAWFISPAS
jgi:hypothetical protein